jgi:hypothetical protein
MRICQQLSLIEAALTNLKTFKLVQQQPNVLAAPGKAKILEALRLLLRVPSLKRVVKPVIDHPVFAQPSDEFRFDNGTGSNFGHRIEELTSRAEWLFEALTSSLPNLDENMIAFRVPPTESLKNLEETIGEVERCLEQGVVHAKVGGSVKFVGVDSGSTWLLLSLGSAAAVVVIKTIALASAVIAQERVRHAQVAAYLKTLDFSIEMMEAAKDKAKIAMSQLVDQKAEEICKGNYDGSPEQTNRLKLVLDTLAGLFFRGATIEPAKLPPADVGSGFPNVEQLLVEASHPKRLASSSADSEVK